jgi:hypothetical protein
MGRIGQVFGKLEGWDIFVSIELVVRKILEHQISQLKILCI